MGSVSRDLAEFVSKLSVDEFDDEVIEQAEQLLLDTIGCSIAAFESPPVQSLRRTYLDDESTEATVLGTSQTASVEYAAFINASMARYLDYNDAYMSTLGACHPSDHIMALVSVAEAENATGDDLIEAIVTAYEIEGRGMDQSPVRGNGFDYVTWGAYSSAASVGKLMDLSTREMVNAIGIAGASNAPLSIARQGEVSMWKGIAHPYVTHNAIQACQMAENGMTGPQQIFEGPSGFFEVVGEGEISFDTDPDVDDLRILETSVKSFACGYYIHSPVAGALELRDDHDIAADDIDSVHVEMFDVAVDRLATPEKWDTDLNRETADHSIPYTVAAALVDGEVTPHQYSEERLRAPEIHELMDKTTVESSEELSEYRNEHPRHIPSITEITVNGETYVRRIDCPLGHPENPMTADQIERKMRENCEGFLTDEQVRNCIDACYSLRELETVDPLVRTLEG